MEFLKAKARGANEILPEEQRQIELKQLELKLSALRAELEATRPLGGGGRGSPFTGRTLREIGTPGMAESARQDIISRLPIHEGDLPFPCHPGTNKPGRAYLR
jgi:hypothetical protein